MENVVVVETLRPVDEACQALERAVADHKFGVMHVHNVRQTLANKGVEFNREVRIFDVCNPHRAKQVLENNVRILQHITDSIKIAEDSTKLLDRTFGPHQAGQPRIGTV